MLSHFNFNCVPIYIVINHLYFSGFLVYGCYGWRNSSEEYRMKGLKPPEDDAEIKETKGDIKLGKLDQDRNSNYFDNME